VARFTIPLENLPPTSSSAQHIVRFRVISEDRNRVSDYSPIFLLDSPGQIPSASVQYAITTSAGIGSGTFVDLIWAGDYISMHKTLDSNIHDIFVKWSYSGIYEYVGRVVGNNFRILKPAAATTVRFKVQLPSYPSEHPVDPDNDPRESSIIQILETAVTPI
jgi:hypothetical protein